MQFYPFPQQTHFGLVIQCLDFGPRRPPRISCAFIEDKVLEDAVSPLPLFWKEKNKTKKNKELFVLMIRHENSFPLWEACDLSLVGYTCVNESDRCWQHTRTSAQAGVTPDVNLYSWMDAQWPRPGNSIVNWAAAWSWPKRFLPSSPWKHRFNYYSRWHRFNHCSDGCTWNDPVRC